MKNKQIRNQDFYSDLAEEYMKETNQDDDGGIHDQLISGMIF